jgi:hypothetical protein
MERVSARTFRRSTFAGYTARTLSGRWASEIFRLAGERPNVILKFAEGGVKRYRESALPADKIGPLELYAQAMTFSGYFERIRGERDDVVVPVDLQDTL